MSYATIQAAAQTLIQGLSAFSDTDVTLGDFDVLTLGSPPYVVLVPASFMHEEDGDGGQRITEWDMLVYLFVRYQTDSSEYANLITQRQSIMDLLDNYPTLDGTTDVLLALVTRARDPQEVFEQSAGSDASPAFLLQVLEVTIIEKTVATGGEYA